MDAFFPFILQLLSGAGGGVLAGKGLGSLSLGRAGNALSGAAGGVLAGPLLGALTGLGSTSGGFELASAAAGLASGGLGGALSTAVIGSLIRKFEK